MFSWYLLHSPHSIFLFIFRLFPAHTNITRVWARFLIVFAFAAYRWCGACWWRRILMCVKACNSLSHQQSDHIKLNVVPKCMRSMFHSVAFNSPIRFLKLQSLCRHKAPACIQRNKVDTQGPKKRLFDPKQPLQMLRLLVEWLYKTPLP